MSLLAFTESTGTTVEIMGPWLNRDQGSKVEVLLSPSEIILTRERVTEISIQNHLKGTIKHIINAKHSLMCIVDTGTDLIVEITSESVKKLNLESGTKVYCLFKANALNIN